MSDAGFKPRWFSKPGDTIAFVAEQRDLSVAALARCMGRDFSIVQGLLSGTTSIDEDIATLLSGCVGGSPQFWLTRQAQYDRDLDKATRAIPGEQLRPWLKALPARDMMTSGWIGATRDPQALARSFLSYFDVADLDEWRERYTSFANSFAFRTSAAFESEQGSLSAWLRQGEIQSTAIACKNWDKDRFIEALNNIRVLTMAKDPSYFIPKLRTMCASTGVAVVFVRAPTGCRASGASRFLSASKAMIILSFRYLSEDHFWFTFFHEAGHLLLHGEHSTFVDGEVSVQSEKEAEANTFSQNMLVPFERADELADLRAQRRDIIRFAVSVGVSPGIVVGQMQHRKTISPAQLNNLKRRFTWSQILHALG